MTSKLCQGRTLVWGGGSALRLLQVGLDRLGRKADFIFHDEDEVSPIASLSPADRPDLETAAQQCTHYAIAIGGPHGRRRSELSKLFRYTYKLRPLSVIHPTAYICPTAILREPVTIFPGAIVHSFAVIGEDCILNTNSVVEHECHLGTGVHIMGSAVVTGRVEIEDFVTVGSHATILPDLHLGNCCVVGAGAVVTANVLPSQTVVGIPAKPLQAKI